MEKKEIALVTGGSRGLGKDMALKLAAKGHHVIITYKSQEADAKSVVNMIQLTGSRAAALPFDAGNIKEINGFVKQLQSLLADKFGSTHIDWLVNNAGIGGYKLISEVDEDFFDELLNIHFKGVYFLTQKLLPLINKGGGIVNVSSGLTRVSMPRSSAYASMKGAIEVFTRYLAKEYGEQGIRANTVAPGAIMTDFGGGHLRSNEELQKRVSEMTALGRPGVADDVGAVVAFLCTDDAKWITGQRIEVSGGMLV